MKQRGFLPLHSCSGKVLTSWLDQLVINIIGNFDWHDSLEGLANGEARVVAALRLIDWLEGVEKVVLRGCAHDHSVHQGEAQVKQSWESASTGLELLDEGRALASQKLIGLIDQDVAELSNRSHIVVSIDLFNLLDKKINVGRQLLRGSGTVRNHVSLILLSSQGWPSDHVDKIASARESCLLKQKTKDKIFKNQ